jgi:hypothetical protein
VRIEDSSNGVELVSKNIQLSVFVAEAVKAFVAAIETLDAFRYIPEPF